MGRVVDVMLTRDRFVLDANGKHVQVNFARDAGERRNARYDLLQRRIGELNGKLTTTRGPDHEEVREKLREAKAQFRKEFPGISSDNASNGVFMWEVQFQPVDAKGQPFGRATRELVRAATRSEAIGKMPGYKMLGYGKLSAVQLTHADSTTYSAAKETRYALEKEYEELEYDIDDFKEDLKGASPKQAERIKAEMAKARADMAELKKKIRSFDIDPFVPGQSVHLGLSIRGGPGFVGILKKIKGGMAYVEGTEEGKFGKRLFKGKAENLSRAAWDASRKSQIQAKIKEFEKRVKDNPRDVEARKGLEYYRGLLENEYYAEDAYVEINSDSPAAIGREFKEAGATLAELKREMADLTFSQSEINSAVAAYNAFKAKDAATFEIEFAGSSKRHALPSHSDPAVENMARKLGLWKGGDDEFPSFTLYRNGEEIGGG